MFVYFVVLPIVLYFEILILDGIQKHNGQRQKPRRQRKNRGHVPPVQEPHDRQARRQERAEWRHGHLQRSREEPFAQTVRRVGRRFRHHQAVLPRRRQRSEENLLGEERRTPESEIRAFFVHPNYGHSHQDFRHLTSQRR